MQNKKSFILYLDQQDLFNKLPDEVAGKLIKHIYSYVNLEHPETDDLLLDIAFSSIKQALKRDLKKYDAYIGKQKVNGAKGGRPKTTQKTQAFISKPKKADSVSVSVSVNDSVSVSKKIEQFVPNTASIDAANSVYPNCSIDDLVIDFVDQATNRKQPFKDLQSGFRNYVRKGWVKPKEQSSKSFAQMATESESPWDENGRLIGLLDDGTFESDNVSNMRVL